MSRWHRTEFDFLPEHAFRPRPGGGMTLEGGGGTPDNSGQNAAAVKNSEISAEQLAWSKEIYAAEAPARARAADIAETTATSAQRQMDLQTQIQQQSLDDYNTTYRPLEQRTVAEAQAYDTPARRAAESASAVSSVEQQLAAQRGATLREQERAGVNPASGRTADLQASIDLNAAKLKAGAGNAASKAVETIGYARKMDAVNLGRGIASAQGTSAALGLQAGQASTAAAGSALAAGQSGVGGMQAGYQSAIAGNNSAGSIYGSISAANQQASATKSANTTAGLAAGASVAGMAIAAVI